MKASKLLLVIPSVALATVPTIVSCGSNENKPLSVIDVENAIFGHHDLKTPTEHPGCDTFIECLAEANNKDRQMELIYSMYAPLFYLKASFSPFDQTTIYDLWKDKTLALASNISKCSSEIKESNVYATYVGYVNLVFQKDWDDFKKNDYLQFTFLLENEQVTPESGKWYLNFNNYRPEPLCWGFLQAHKGSQTLLFYINYLGYESDFSEFPPNWHNWQ